MASSDRPASMKRHCTIIHTDDAVQWCEYTKKLFAKDKRQHLTIDSINIDELDYENPPQIEAAIKNSYLVVILTSPDMKIFILEKSSWFVPLMSRVPVGTSLVFLLCYVNIEDFQQTIRGPFSPLADIKCDTMTSDPKVNRNIVADYIEIIDQNERLSKRQKPKQRKKPIPAPETSIIKAVSPRKVHGAKEHVLIASTSPLEGVIEVGFVDSPEKYDTKSINPYTFRFKTPDKPPGSYKLQVFKDGKEIHQHPFYYITPSDTAFQSIGYLMQVFSVKDKDSLDQKLVDMMEKSMTDDNSLYVLFEEIQAAFPEGNTKSEAEIPTLLHFAAANGLSEFCSFLLDVPGSVAASQIENKHGMDPSDLAECKGHLELAEHIRNYMQTKAVVTTCNWYIGMSNGGKKVNTESDYIKMHSVVEKEEDDLYLTVTEQEMHDNKTDLNLTERRGGKPKTLPPIPSQDRANTEPTPSNSEIPTEKRRNAAEFMGLTRKDSIEAPAAFGSSCQAELIQIMESVKRGHFNMDDANLLFNDWKNRNKGGESNSFKKKQENLNQLRQHYQTIFRLTEQAADEVSSRTGKGLLHRMLSKKPRKKGCTQISEPYQLRSNKSVTSLMESERSSSSSTSSRESNNSITELFYSDSDHSDEDSYVVTRKKSSSTSTLTDNRISRKIMFLQSTENIENECPLLPPRTCRK